METAEKFSSKMSRKVLKQLRKYADESNKPISAVLEEAVTEYLAGVLLRPTVLRAATDVVSEHSELLERLAK